MNRFAVLLALFSVVCLATTVIAEDLEDEGVVDIHSRSLKSDYKILCDPYDSVKTCKDPYYCKYYGYVCGFKDVCVDVKVKFCKKFKTFVKYVHYKKVFFKKCVEYDYKIEKKCEKKKVCGKYACAKRVKKVVVVRKHHH